MQTIVPVKLVAVGDGCVGKTCLLYSFATGTFSEDYCVTIFDNYSALMRVDDKNINLSLWDTAGQVEYGRLRYLSYPNTDVFLVCYSLISPVSLLNVTNQWIPEIQHFNPSTPFLLVGTKSDLINDKDILHRLNEKGLKPLTKEDGDKVANEFKASKHIVCSALTRENIKEVFDEAVRASFFVQEKEQNKKNKKSGCILL
jgi:small GTP-binding protein